MMPLSHMDKSRMIVLMKPKLSDIPPRMHKTTIEIDLDQLRKAEENLGTHGFKETINRALAEVNRRAALRRGAQYLAEERDSVLDWDEFWSMREPRA